MWFQKIMAKWKEEDWQRSITAEKDHNEWYALITTVSSKKHLDTADSSYKVKLPAIFPYMLSVPLADFLNQNSPLRPKRKGNQTRRGCTFDTGCFDKAIRNTGADEVRCGANFLYKRWLLGFCVSRFA